MLNSDYRQLCAVSLPYAGRQKYMHTFEAASPSMADGFADYLGPVSTLLRAAGVKEGLVHMTVDEKIVVAGMSQRRPKPHVDGCFMPAAGKWGHPQWLHCCNNIPVSEFSRMAVIVASSLEGCRAWRGMFDSQPKADGDLSHLSLSEGERLPANVGFLLSPDCIHESMLQPKTAPRSFLRLALPIDFEF